eukprot:6027544-Pyramimonas_sp.AAC.2
MSTPNINESESTIRNTTGRRNNRRRGKWSQVFAKNFWERFQRQLAMRAGVPVASVTPLRTRASPVGPAGDGSGVGDSAPQTEIDCEARACPHHAHLTSV